MSTAVNQTVTPKEVLKGYFDGLRNRSGWEAFLAEDMQFTRGNGQTTTGKEHYIMGTTRFLQFVRSFAIRELLIDGDQAAAVVDYELLSPKGNSGHCIVAEIFSVAGDKIASSAIFFDTAGFAEFIAKG